MHPADLVYAIDKGRLLFTANVPGGVFPKGIDVYKRQVHCVPSNPLRDAQIWSILLHIALAASGFSCLRPENTSGDSGV